MFTTPAKICKRRRPNKSGRNRNRIRRFGVATVEMAFVAPVIMLLVFTSMEFTRMMMVRQSLTNAARAGCRDACLITTQNSADSDAVVRNNLQGVVANRSDTDVVRVVITPAFTTAPDAGTSITTYVEVDCEDVSWLPPFFFAGAKIRGTATMVRE